MDSSQGRHPDAEMETFLPNTNNTDNTNPKHKPVIVRTVKDGEALGTKRGILDDLFKLRNNPSPTTDFETFTHLLKAALGSGILSMPYAFKCSGLAIGLLATLVTAFVCTYCSYLLVKCAHSLYRRLNISKMSYADVAEHSFANGPRPFRKWAKVARMCVITCLFVTYFGAISCYTVIAGENFKQLVEHYFHFNGNIRIYILATLPVLLVLGFIPNLKALAPFSLAANILIGSGLGITIFYLVQNLSNPFTVRQTPEQLIDLPATFSITVFAMEAIGLMMPLENNMKTPTHFLGVFGVLNRGMTVVSLVYILLGVLGFLSYGDLTEANITKNLDINLVAPQVAKLFIALSVLLTYVLQYFVCLDILWNAVRDNFVKQERLYNGFCRMTLVGGSVLLAIAVPNIGPFVSLIGALCFSFLGILFPLVIEMVTYSQKVSMVKLIFRNLFIVLFGIMALCVGTYTSIQDILSIYLPEATDTILSNSTGTVSSR